jgi:hypothetical protein
LCPAQLPGAPEPLVTHDLIGINSNVVYEVLPHQAGRREAHAVAVHQLQEIPPSLIDEGYARQVKRE